MSYEAYKVLHLTGLCLVFLGFGGLLLGPRGNEAPPKRALILHGVGLLVILVAGLGALTAMSIEWPWPGWLYAKLGAWLMLGALPVLYKRRIVTAAVVWIVAVAVAATAAWLAIQKPF